MFRILNQTGYLQSVFFFRRKYLGSNGWVMVERKTGLSFLNRGSFWVILPKNRQHVRYIFWIIYNKFVSFCNISCLVPNISLWSGWSIFFKVKDGGSPAPVALKWRNAITVGPFLGILTTWARELGILFLLNACSCGDVSIHNLRNFSGIVLNPRFITSCLLWGWKCQCLLQKSSGTVGVTIVSATDTVKQSTN
jgi:hypothetical protein